MMVDPEVEDRADAAFRAALRVDELAEVGVEPHAVRERLRRRRGLVAAVATAVVVVLALATVPLLRYASSDTTAGDPTFRTPPAGWRIEQYRDVSIFVPDSWGYASAPYADWCNVSPDGQPLPAQQKPYVSLGVPNALALTQGAWNCPAQPQSLLSEHVELKEAGPQPDSPAPLVERQGDWWVAIRILDSQQITVKVVSRNQDLAKRIVDSAALGGPCPATSPVQENQRNDSTVDLTAFTTSERAVICQYQPGRIAPPSQFEGAGGPFKLTGLQGASVLSAHATRELVSGLRTARAMEPAVASCSATDASLKFAVALHLFAGQRETTIYLTAGNCMIYAKYAPIGPETGGIDLGSAVHPWTKQVCAVIVKPPVLVPSDVGTWACSR